MDAKRRASIQINVCRLFCLASHECELCTRYRRDFDDVQSLYSVLLLLLILLLRAYRCYLCVLMPILFSSKWQPLIKYALKLSRCERKIFKCKMLRIAIWRKNKIEQNRVKCGMAFILRIARRCVVYMQMKTVCIRATMLMWCNMRRESNLI